MKFFHFCCLLFLGLNQISAYAASSFDIGKDHCKDCGTILVGGTKLEKNKIYWRGSEVLDWLSFSNQTGDASFGATGNAVYLQEGSPPNQWIFNSSANVTINQPITKNGDKPLVLIKLGSFLRL